MDEIVKSLAELSVAPNSLTGLVYHPETLLHTYDPDENKCKNHVENPIRVKRIFERFQEKKLIERCDLVENFEEINPKIVGEIHGEDYLEYLSNLWPENCKKTKMNYKDTYFNEHSTRAAFLAAEGTRLAVENVHSGKWKNAFALVRPPGHHAAALENRIQGFCFINNVVVAVKHLISQKGKMKVAILDWDVHHGDSTQKMTYNDPDILYISIHNFQHGAFYPGASGSVKNVGAGLGEGFNLNFPLNPIKGQFIGDSEYIYIFERAILPVLKQFNPDMVVVSSGFDCLVNDPLGKLKVTSNGLSYMLLRIQQEISQKIVVVLEGGYNFDEIAVASECLLRVLLGEYYPNEACRTPSSRYQLMKTLNLSGLFLEQIIENLNVWKKYWKCLEENQLEEKVEKIKCDLFVVPNKHKYVADENQLKKMNCSMEELNTYNLLKDKFGEKVIEFLPIILGFEKHENKVDIIYENLNKDGFSNVVNLVFPNASMDGMVVSDLFVKFKFYVRAYQIVNENGQVLESRRNHQIRLPVQETFQYFGRIFQAEESLEKCVEAIDQIIAFVDRFIIFCEQNQISFMQPRLLVFFHRETGDVVCRFSNVLGLEEHFDNNSRLCLIGAKNFMEEFKNSLIK